MGMNNTRNGKWEIEKKIIFLFKRQLTFYNKAYSIVLCGLSCIKK